MTQNLTTRFFLLVAKTRQNIMAQQKTSRNLGTNGRHNSVTQSQSLLNVNELETRAKATVKDIDELYAALQGLVPKKSHGNGGLRANQRNARSGTSGTETDTGRSSEERDQPSRFRRYHSEKYPKKQWTDTNMNFVMAKPAAKKPVLQKTVPVKPALDNVRLSDERHIVSDTEIEVNHMRTNEPKKIRRYSSLPAYEEEDGIEIGENQKRSKFSLFHRHRQSKPGKKNTSSWRSFFSTLSLKRKKSKKYGKNKTGQSNNAKTMQNGNRTPKNQAKSAQERTPRSTPRSSVDAGRNIGINSSVRKSGRKRMAPEPPVSSGNTTLNVPVETPDFEPRERTNAMDKKTDLVQKKLSAWYKLAMQETNNSMPKPLRITRSHENLLTDTEVIRKRGAFSSDTDSYSGGDRNRINIVPKTRVRKTRSRRNRRRERARFHSCPNVKLVTKALDEAGKKANTLKQDSNTAKNDECTDDASGANHITTVKPVEAKISFGSSMDNEEPVADFMKTQNVNARNWLTRQCSKTTISCIRPLQLNLFYSESPSRETAHRSRSAIRRPNVAGKESGAGDPQEFAFKIRRSSSRRRKRRSFKRGQTRLPHQSPFYVPPSTPTTAKAKEEYSSISKDSGLGSPDLNDDKRFATFPVMKRDQRFAKLHSESEDSGWASGQRRFTSTSETAIQTDPVIVMTTVSRVRRTLPPNVIVGNIGQSEA